MKRCWLAMCFCVLAMNMAPAQNPIYAANVNDNAAGLNPSSDVVTNEITKAIPAPQPVARSLPPTITVSTTALLELHAMRKNAMDLCLALPTKYRTQLPECADIFRHEIRLQAIAKDKK